MAILFCKEDREFYFLSNFSIHGFVVNGLRYKTNEHFYQSKKAINYGDERAILAAPSPWKARELGKAKAQGGLIEWTEDQVVFWNSMRITIMMQGLIEKFIQNPDILDKLIATGSEELIEFAPWDDYWGNGRDGKGKNMLGQCLMAVRNIYGGTAFKIGWPQ